MVIPRHLRHRHDKVFGPPLVDETINSILSPRHFAVAEKLAHFVDVTDVLVELPGNCMPGEVKDHGCVETLPRRQFFEDPIRDTILVRFQRMKPIGVAGIDSLRDQEYPALLRFLFTVAEDLY